MRLVTLYNGRRYEGVPGRADFRVIEFREHGIPIAPPPSILGTNDPDTKATRELIGSHALADIAQLAAFCDARKIARFRNAADAAPTSDSIAFAEGDVLANSAAGASAGKLPNVLAEDTWDLFRVLLR